jgi:transcription initiation factor IIE alpha subunit
MNKRDRVLKVLQSSKRVTTEQLREETGVYNVFKYIRLLRDRGHIIYTVQNTPTDVYYELQNKAPLG